MASRLLKDQATEEPDMIERDGVGMPPALRLERGRALAVMVCADVREVDRVGRQLTEVNTGCLVTYRRVEDMRAYPPAGRITTVILATEDPPDRIREALRWLRRRWPRSVIAVIGRKGCGVEEMVAREGGAAYLTRPVPLGQWRAVLAHVQAAQAAQA